MSGCPGHPHGHPQFAVLILVHKGIAIKLQQHQYALKKNFLRRLIYPMLFWQAKLGGGGGRPLLSDTWGGGGVKLAPGILADPPTHPHQKIFPQEKNEIYQRGPNLEVDFRYTNFFLASDPPPRYSINRPLSKGLGGGGARLLLSMMLLYVLQRGGGVSRGG